jgi:uroporphyrinogen III methyltransferase/synthase
VTEIREASRLKKSPREVVGAVLGRDFPDTRVSLGERIVDFVDPDVRAVPLWAADLPEPLPSGLEGFAFPAAEPAAGAALLFRAGDAVLREMRRFYLPPVVLAGAGPGGEGLMTVAARRAVERADVVLSDCLCGEEVLRGMRKGAACVAVGKRCGVPSATQEEINLRLVREALAGHRVVRLKGGDPSVFGRLEEEIGALRAAGLSYRVLPGVGAASGAAAFIGQPLTVREAASELILSTGRLAGGGKNPFPLGAHAPAIALYMSRKVLAERMADLLAAGYPPETPVVIVEQVGSPRARAVAGTVATLPAEADRLGVGTPAVVLVGAQFHTPDHLPLAGVRIWLPAERETAESHRRELEELGAVCTIAPLIEPVPLAIDANAVFARPFDWVVFTSKKAVDAFFDLLAQWGFDSRWLPRVAAMGHPTIEKLRARGIEPDLIPPEPTRVALGSSLAGLGLSGARVLIPGSAVAPDHLRQVLAPLAAEVVRVDLYTLRYPEMKEVPDAGVVLFSSPTTVESAKRSGLLEGIRARGMAVGGIGPATCGLLRREGLPPDVVPDGTSAADLARALRRHYVRRRLAGMEARG